jgi:hypothetical protein
MDDMTTEMTTEDRIAKLEGQSAKLQTKQGELYAQLRRAQLEQWQGRIDDLEVQMHLGALEANERITALADQLRSRWAATRLQMEMTPSTATEVIDRLRVGVEKAYEEMRQAILESKQKVTHS